MELGKTLAKGKTLETNSHTLRAVGYCRTSGKDRTSISSQKEITKKFIEDKEWKFISHYVDKHKSGAKVAGRDDFQKMIQDAANDEFDIIVPYDVTRFARDGFDILSNAKYLKKEFAVSVVDTQNSFNNLSGDNIITNFLYAGLSEQERINIMKRTIRGRIANAKNGLKWTSKLPVGRGYEPDRNPKWFINDNGKKLRKLLTRYADGEPLASLAREYKIKFPQTINRTVRQSQLSGIYIAKFNSPEIGINNLEVSVPQIPEVITPELETRCRERAAHNHKWNKQAKQKYLLTGFVKCAHCGHSLKGRIQGKMYYNHYYEDSKLGCPFTSIRGDLIEPIVFDYLYGFFLDEPAYSHAVRRALPSDDDRKALIKDIQSVKKQIVRLNKDESKLVDAFCAGIKKTSVMINKQQKIIDERQTLENRLYGLRETLANMIDSRQTERDAKLLRLKLMSKYWNQDWRHLSYEDIRKFLHFLFGVNPKKSGYGIFVGRIKSKWKITFEGCTESIDIEKLEKTVDEIIPAVDELKSDVKDAEQVLESLRQCSPSVLRKTSNK